MTKLRAILETGVQARASDWHIREGSTVVLRVDAQLVEVANFIPTREFLQEAIKEICDERVHDQFWETGDADFAHQEEGVGRFRVNLHKQRNLISLTLRHVKDQVPEIEKLGLPEVILKIAEMHRGIVLVTGTTGSGKSTTMACMLEYMNRTMARHIITVEDPIEYTFSDRNCVFEQREVGIDTLSFHQALVSSLRQDPDVIVIGEMRRRESFDTALQAADTGHMVMTTLHTTNAPQTIQRILDFYPHEEREQIRIALATNLSAIVCQRLMPRAVGKGVVPGLEIMLNTPVIRKILMEGHLNRLEQAIEGSNSEGMMSFNQCLLKLVNEGLITEQVALERASNPEALQMNLKGIFLNTDGGIIS
ncbi:MAG: PilT/PilU family type 4a pilus ATPase [Lentisphaeria bacterium]|nr:PilT/PilU family type 4a pilus ATPase [Lentisphaeria bacterium]